MKKINMNINLNFLAMRKSTIFKIALSTVFVFFVTTMFAQQDMTDLSDHNIYGYGAGTITDGSDDTDAMYVTVNAQIPFVVAPDAVFSPNYDFGTDPDDVNGSTWAWLAYTTGDVVQAWTITTAPNLAAKTANAGVGRTVDYSAYGGGLTAQNFALVTAPAAGGTFYLSVKETNSGCTDADSTEIAVTVFPVPTITIDNTQDDAYQIGSANCGNSDDITFNIDVTGWQMYDLGMSLDVDNVDATDTQTDELADWDEDSTSYSLEDVSRSDNGNLNDHHADSTSQYNITDNGTDFNAGTGAVNQDRITITKDLKVIKNAITRYTYTFHGVNDQISRKSNYWSDVTWSYPYTVYTPATTSLVFYAKPAPSTGAIYVIPN